MESTTTYKRISISNIDSLDLEAENMKLSILLCSPKLNIVTDCLLYNRHNACRENRNFMARILT